VHATMRILEHCQEPEVFGEYSIRPFFVVGYASHFLEEPREDHLVAVKQILCYVVWVPAIGGFGSAGRREIMCC
jgi:hypothetical protein